MTQKTAHDVLEYLYDRVGFVPTAAQTPIMASRKRFVLVAGGEQAGKSLMASKFLLGRMFEVADAGLYWLVAADYERTRAEFEYLVEDFANLGVLREASKRVDPGRIILADGTRIETKSAKDPRTLAMRAPDGIVGCEASQLDLDTFYRLRGRCAPKRGWMFLSGTFEGSLGWYPQMHMSWSMATDEEESFSLPSYSNTHLYPEGVNDPEIQRLKRGSSDDFFLERIEGIPSPPTGLVFPEFRADLHVADTSWEVGSPVHLWMDPGYAGAYAVAAVQVRSDTIHVIDEVYEQGMVTEEIIDVCRGRPWWKDVAHGVIDVAGYQHQAMAAPAEIWLKETGLYLSSQRVLINDGTERLKSFLKPDPITHESRVKVSPKCAGLLSEFGAVPSPFDGQTRAYRWKMDRDGNIVGTTPDDKNNHGIKALIYGIVDKYGYGYVRGQDRIAVKRW